MDSFQLRFPDSQTKRILLSSNRENMLHFAPPSSKTNFPQVSDMPVIPFEDASPQLLRVAVVLPACKDRLETTVSLLNKYKRLEYFAYERKNVWHVGLGSRTSLRVDPKGETALIYGQGKERHCLIPGSLTDFAKNFVAEQSQQHEGKMFGQVGFNYGAHVRRQPYTPGRWPMLTIMVSELEITLSPENITLQGYDEQLVTEVSDFLKVQSPLNFLARIPQPVSTQQNEEEYKILVSKALKEIKAGKYNKIIASRFVDLDRLVDIPATLLYGRRANNPARSYILNHGGFQATGFSPELVMAFQKGMVVTE